MFEIIRGLLTMLFGIICIALLGLGISHSIKIIEASPFSLKKSIFTLLAVSLFMHCVIFLLGWSFLHFIFSISIQLNFMWLFKDYPYFKASDIRFILGIPLTILNHIILIFTVESCGFSTITVIITFLSIWLAPALTILSMSATDEVVSLEGTIRIYSSGISEFIDNVFEKKENKD